MARIDETTKYQVNPTGVPVDDDFSLEDILAEYGGGRETKLMRDVETELDPLAAARPKAEKPLPPTPKHRREEPVKEENAVEPPTPVKEPKPVTLEEVVGSTVSAVMEEAQEPLLTPRRGLFSRRKLEETEQLYDAPEPKEEPVAEPIGPEPELWEAAAECKTQWQSGRAVMLPALLMALVLVVGIAFVVPSQAAADTGNVGKLVDYFQSNNSTFTLNANSRFFLTAEPTGELLQTIQLAQRQFAADGRPTSNPMDIVWGDTAMLRAGDIYIQLVSSDSNIGAEGYKITVTTYATVIATEETPVRRTRARRMGSRITKPLSQKTGMETTQPISSMASSGFF